MSTWLTSEQGNRLRRSHRLVRDRELHEHQRNRSGHRERADLEIELDVRLAETLLCLSFDGEAGDDVELRGRASRLGRCGREGGRGLSIGIRACHGRRGLRT